jgi:TolB-like protein
MRVRDLVVLCCMGLVALIEPAPSQAQELLKEAATRLATEIVADPAVQKLKGEVLAIPPFVNVAVANDTLSRLLQEKLTTAFIKAKHFKVVELTGVEQAMKEMQIGATDLSERDNQQELGKAVGASYLLLGSIAETRRVTSIDCRLIAIGRGTCVTAAETTITVSTSAPPKPVAPTPADPLQKPAPAAQPAPRDQPALPPPPRTGATLRQAWREPIRGAQLHTFTVGNLRGDGARLATLEDQATEQYQDDVHICLYAWKTGAFRSIWSSEQVPFRNDAKGYLRLLNADGLPQLTYTSMDSALLFRWNGAGYGASGQFKIPILDNVHASGYRAVGIDYYRGGLLAEKPTVDEEGATVWKFLKLTHDRRTDIFGDTMTAGDFDGDGQIEIAIKPYKDYTSAYRDTPAPAPIEIYGLDGQRKAITQEKYNGRMTNWKPAGVQRALLIAGRNAFITEDGEIKRAGGYAIVIQWDGETYNEVWKSERQGQEIIDLQVGDPKNEGTDGLLILSRERKDYYLTKIIVE